MNCDYLHCGGREDNDSPGTEVDVSDYMVPAEYFEKNQPCRDFWEKGDPNECWRFKRDEECKYCHRLFNPPKGMDPGEVEKIMALAAPIMYRRDQEYHRNKRQKTGGGSGDVTYASSSGDRWAGEQYFPDVRENTGKGSKRNLPPGRDGDGKSKGKAKGDKRSRTNTVLTPNDRSTYYGPPSRTSTYSSYRGSSRDSASREGWYQGTSWSNSQGSSWNRSSSWQRRGGW